MQGANTDGNDKAKRMMLDVKIQVQTLVVKLQKTLLEPSVTPKELNRAVRRILLHALNTGRADAVFCPH